MKTLIEQQISEMGSAKVQLCMWIKWLKRDKVTGEVEIVDLPFNSKMMEIFQGSNIEEILEKMFANIKTQVENPKLPESGFEFVRIIHLDISFHKLQLTRGSSYIDLPVWIASKKAVLNPQNKKDEECFKWAVIAALHHEDIKKDPRGYQS